jgi:hypothetical protein
MRKSTSPESRPHLAFAMAAALGATALMTAGAAWAEPPPGTNPQGPANPSISDGPKDPTLPKAPTPPNGPASPWHPANPAAPDTLPPGTPDMPGSSNGQPEGVIPPPRTGDPNVVVPPDQGTGTMPVIPAPGTPGGNPDVQPQ